MTGIKINFFFVFVLLLLLCSCTKNALFTHRKYTGGFYRESVSAVHSTKDHSLRSTHTETPALLESKHSKPETDFANLKTVPGPGERPVARFKMQQNFHTRPPVKTIKRKLQTTHALINSGQAHRQSVVNAQKKKSLYISPELAAVLKVIMIVLTVIAVALLVVYVFFYSSLVAASANLLKISLAAVLLLILALIILRKAG